MSNLTFFSEKRNRDKNPTAQYPTALIQGQGFGANQALSEIITKSASKQTYYTIHFLVDRDRIRNAYQAYGYFRWLDDWLDQKSVDRTERIAFVTRQQAIMERCYQHDPPCDVTTEERMLVDLIHSDQEENSGLQLYIRNIMAVMAFDANRRGRPISQAELDKYSCHLATAVTEALHYFIGHDEPSSHDETRYLAATAAHIIHLLRDTYEDIAAGYYNVPEACLHRVTIQPCDVASAPYRAWVRSRVKLARTYFKAGKAYLSGVKNLRCRLAGYAYIARFEYVLNLIEREDFTLRADYHERHSLRAGFAIGWTMGLAMGWSLCRNGWKRLGLPASQRR